MRFLITGGSGYLAQALAEHLVSLGEEVLLASRQGDNQRHKVAGCSYIVIDYLQTSKLGNVLEGIDVVIHCAGLNAAESSKNPQLAEEVNTRYTEWLVNQSVGLVKSFIYISTIHVYSSKLSGEIDELTETNNQHPYALSHLNGEKALLMRVSEFPNGAFSIRLANTFGLPIEPSSTGWDLVINELCKQAILNHKITLRSDPNTERNFIPLASAVERIVQLIFYTSRDLTIGTYNLGAISNKSLREVTTLIKNICLNMFDLDIQVNFPVTPTTSDTHFVFKSLNINFDNYDLEDSITKLLSHTKVYHEKGLL